MRSLNREYRDARRLVSQPRCEFCRAERLRPACSCDPTGDQFGAQRGPDYGGTSSGIGLLNGNVGKIAKGDEPGFEDKSAKD
jgi:hypothetical protein